MPTVKRQKDPEPPRMEATESEAAKAAEATERKRKAKSSYDQSMIAGGAVNPAYTQGHKTQQGQ